MKNYLVTGGAGFIGSKLTKKIIDNGSKVVVIDNLSTGLQKNIHPNCKFIQGDFSCDITLQKIRNEKFDGVFHIGGQSSGEVSYESPEYDLNTNVLSTLKLLEMYRKNNWKGRFVYASSMSVYGEQANKDFYSEADSTNPKSIYAIGKLTSERYLKIYSDEYNIPFCVLRYFNVYGPGQALDNLKQGMLSIFLKQMIDSNFEYIHVKGDIGRYRDFVYIDDVIDVTLSAMDDINYKNQIINVCTSEKTTVQNLIKYLADATGINKEIVVRGTTAGDQFGIYGDNKKLTSIYGNQLIDIKCGIDKTVAWALNGEVK